MTFPRLFILIATLMVLSAMPSIAQAQSAYNQYMETLSELNRIDPMQRSSYERADKILRRRVLDNKNKVIGEVNDIILSSNGSIESLYVDFNRLRLGPAVYLNYRQMNISSVSNGYALAFDDNQMENIYPDLLANIATAAGEDEDDTSVKNVVGATVKSEDGRKIGEVKNVLFSANGGRAEVLYLAMAFGVLRGQKVGLPYGSLEYRPTAGGKAEIIATKEQADAIIDFVKSE
ncbi:MAG: hypothetical protein DHS20C02_15330 [Micavibrio sp.]|nr:MAG: hypothetical protein DHS20C02_15330 [Micavibrio sp.]